MPIAASTEKTIISSGVVPSQRSRAKPIPKNASNVNAASMARPRLSSARIVRRA